MIDRRPQEGEIWKVRSDSRVEPRGVCRILQVHNYTCTVVFMNKENWQLLTDHLEPASPEDVALEELASMG